MKEIRMSSRHEGRSWVILIDGKPMPGIHLEIPKGHSARPGSKQVVTIDGKKVPAGVKVFRDEELFVVSK